MSENATNRELACRCWGRLLVTRRFKSNYRARRSPTTIYDLVSD